MYLRRTVSTFSLLADASEIAMSLAFCLLLRKARIAKPSVTGSCRWSDISIHLKSYQTTGTGTGKHLKSTFKSTFLLVSLQGDSDRRNLSGLGIRVVWKLFNIGPLEWANVPHTVGSRTFSPESSHQGPNSNKSAERVFLKRRDLLRRGSFAQLRVKRRGSGSKYHN